ARLLRVEADFPGGLTATRELALGGDLADELATELTGVPVDVAGRGHDAAAATLRDGTEDLAVVALEEGDAELVVVLDPAARPALGDLQRIAGRHRVSPIGGADPRSGAAIVRVDRGTVPLREDTTLRMVWPIAEQRAQADMHFDLFPTSPEMSPG